jgi:hypothetical protein
LYGFKNCKTKIYISSRKNESVIFLFVKAVLYLY